MPQKKRNDNQNTTNIELQCRAFTVMNEISAIPRDDAKRKEKYEHYEQNQYYTKRKWDPRK